jgi:murein DD-endopeptidase MepM/ murein hydrolase activator NlpD
MPLRDAEVTSPFGYRIHPVFGYNTFHRGVDFRGKRGAGVYAAAAGKVVEIGRDGVLGLYVVVEHSGLYTTTYAHMSEATVRLNQEVLSGSMIGKVGNTGISTGPHLHFEIAQGERLLDPLELLPLISE